MSKLLLVRLSSMGDIIHTLPALTDLARARPGIRLDWVVEEGFAALPRLHPSVDRVIPFALRRWRRMPLAPETRAEVAALRQALAAPQYGRVVDAQGLIKSAMVARQAGAPVAGYDWASAREPLASLAYADAYPVPRALHAVERTRRLFAAAFDYRIDTPPDYGLAVPALAQPWRPDGAYAVLLTATSRADKEWMEANWIALGTRLAAEGLACVLPWGSDAERERAERLAAAMPNALVAPKLDLGSAARLLADARVVVGVDTGLAHLAAAVATPVVAIFCASDPALTGVLAGSYAVNLGRRGAAPDVDTVWAATTQGLAAR
ncbi:lipopolysaccharide heptosyltransferase I [Jeongeupia sp. USM3]|uniref:lipopolysaccharide heptosyltransferase I n=1 Tax=Jeongeupia sp. USM3 TaxID=1906741 RepID=UPI00089DDDA6|nr:lipopolysaccharide heptosyltransferase I [Jeongeupia sp. USM3]AOY02299.1 lipopolysaccharide heptosyltransferase I [Jeongeupia sp. USM3]